MLYSHTMSSRLGYASSLAPEGQIQNSGAEELCMEKSLASASLIKIKLWKKSVGSVPGLGFHGLAEEDPLRRWLTPGSVSKAPSSLSAPQGLSGSRTIMVQILLRVIQQEKSLLFFQLECFRFSTAD